MEGVKVKSCPKNKCSSKVQIPEKKKLSIGMKYLYFVTSNLWQYLTPIKCAYLKYNHLKTKKWHLVINKKQNWLLHFLSVCLVSICWINMLYSSFVTTRVQYLTIIDWPYISVILFHIGIRNIGYHIGIQSTERALNPFLRSNTLQLR